MKLVTLRSTVGGQFDLTALHKAVHDHGPFEPDTDYTFHIDLVAPAFTKPATEVSVDAPPPRVARKSAGDKAL